MEFKDEKFVIHYAFIEDFKHSIIEEWTEYITSLDLGVHYTSTDDDEIDSYLITDEKKWLLSKIKYGI